MLKTPALRSGQSAKLLDFGDAEVAYRRRLMAMGLYPGVVVDVVGRAPMGCPLYLRAGSLRLVIRETEACELSWESV